MIKIYDKNSKNSKALEKVCRKLKINKDGIVFAAYEKFLFSFLFAYAVTGTTLYLFAENSKNTQTFKLNEVKGISVDKHHNLNIDFKNGNLINLTSIVNITKTNISLIKQLDKSIRG